MAGAHADAALPLARRVLSARGLTDPNKASAFLDPKLTQLHDPSLIPDLDKAAARLLGALRAGEPIVIYGDYDVDGITATAILYHTFKHIAPGAPVTTYVPHRLEEGYGLNAEALIGLAAQGARVIVSVDCGITAVAPAIAAKAAGVDLIITDHHHPPATMEELPEAYAVVHPRRADSLYPFGELCGAGVAYKLAWRLATLSAGGSRVNEPLRALLVELLAFAALGTIADIVPLVDENRVLARFGLVRARRSMFVGLRALVEASGLCDEAIGELEVGFRLGPRLNAAGRMGHAKDAVELFTTATEARARQIAEHLSTQNEQRRKVERGILDRACEMAEAGGMTGADRRAIVLADESWHAGVVGIVCSRLVERYHRPAILMQTRDGSCHGSGRSIDGFDLHAALTHCREHLDKFGGHTMAAGLHLSEVKLSAFREDLIAFANSRITPEQLRAQVTIDCPVRAGDLSGQSVAELESMAPFGAGNPSVRLLMSGATVVGVPKLMGASGKHLAISLKPGDGAGGPMLRAVAWNWGEHVGQFAPGVRVDAVITPKLSTWGGRTSVEAEISDVRLHAPAMT